MVKLNIKPKDLALTGVCLGISALSIYSILNNGRNKGEHEENIKNYLSNFDCPINETRSGCYIDILNEEMSKDLKSRDLFKIEALVGRVDRNLQSALNNAISHIMLFYRDGDKITLYQKDGKPTEIGAVKEYLDRCRKTASGADTINSDAVWRGGGLNFHSNSAYKFEDLLMKYGAFKSK